MFTTFHDFKRAEQQIPEGPRREGDRWELPPPLSVSIREIWQRTLIQWISNLQN